MSFKQRTIDDRMLQQNERLLRAGQARSLFNSPQRKELETQLEGWLPKFLAALDPKEVSAEYKARLAPALAVFARTHELCSILAGLLDSWGRATDKELLVESTVGPLVLGEDEETDAERLHVWSAGFVRLFPQTVLPPALQPDAVKKQLAAHAHAHAGLPASTQGQTFRAARANLVALRAQGYECWKRLHDLLDGEYGTAPGSFAIKSEFGYDRRLRGVGANRRKRVSDPQPVVQANGVEKHGDAEKPAGMAVGVSAS